MNNAHNTHSQVHTGESAGKLGKEELLRLVIVDMLEQADKALVNMYYPHLQRIALASQAIANTVPVAQTVEAAPASVRYDFSKFTHKPVEAAAPRQAELLDEHDPRADVFGVAEARERVAASYMSKEDLTNVA